MPSSAEITGDGAPACRPVCSVVMPTLNQCRFLAAAVESVFSQDGAADLELVVLDGGSTDGTQEELARLAQHWGPALRWWSGKDDGPAQAVNRAVGLARGEIIGWLNSDDLYAPGAVARALEVFHRQPDLVMVYGEGEHVDVDGHFMERYPTLPPQTALHRFLEGCFICQPTAFFRRSVFQALGGLDESLRAAFDFDFWLRLFKAFPGQVGFVAEVQALSRLHEGGITLRQRERVALEGMAVLHRHLGVAPPAWLLTHFEERCSSHPGPGPSVDLRTDLERLVTLAKAWLAPAGEQLLRRRLLEDARLRLALPQVYVGVHADGWAGPQLQLRVHQPDPPATELRLRGRHARPGGGSLRLRLCSPGAAELPALVPRPGVFELVVPLHERTSGASFEVTIHALDVFVPARVEPGSKDPRALAFQVEALSLGFER